MKRVGADGSHSDGGEPLHPELTFAPQREECE
ncbi:hypothetical protein ACVWW5_002707 [Bradyrhizobium sp. LM3.4]